jgi:hypothetical protein
MSVVVGDTVIYQTLFDDYIELTLFHYDHRLSGNRVASGNVVLTLE